MGNRRLWSSEGVLRGKGAVLWGYVLDFGTKNGDFWLAGPKLGVFLVDIKLTISLKYRRKTNIDRLYSI